MFLYWGKRFKRHAVIVVKPVIMHRTLTLNHSDVLAMSLLNMQF